MSVLRKCAFCHCHSGKLPHQAEDADSKLSMRRPKLKDYQDCDCRNAMRHVLATRDVGVGFGAVIGRAAMTWAHGRTTSLTKDASSALLMW